MVDRQLTRQPRRPRQEPPMPDLYLPAMWPLDLQRALVKRFKAWQRRRLYRRLLRLSDAELRARDLDRGRLQALASRPLRC